MKETGCAHVRALAPARLEELADGYKYCCRYASHWRHRHHYHPHHLEAAEVAAPGTAVPGASDGTPRLAGRETAPGLASSTSNTNPRAEGREAERKRRKLPADGVAVGRLAAQLATRLDIPTCRTCGLMDDGPCHLHLCLECVFIGCAPSPQPRPGGAATRPQRHIISHLRQAGHTFAMELHSLQVYCVECEDYVYHHTFRRVREQEVLAANLFLALLKDPSQAKAHAKAGGVAQLAWHPSPEQLRQLATATIPIPCNRLRGLWNLGSTCFMNAILQVLLHTPPLRTYFLTERHFNCAEDPSRCMACQMAILFQNNYVGSKAPFVPVSFLYTLWSTSKALAGYSQQDAHEFFIAALNGIHAGCAERTATPALAAIGRAQAALLPSPTSLRNPSGWGCACVVHSSFAGSLQSRVTCLHCGATTDSIDPILDVSLDVSGLTQALAGVKATARSMPSLTDCLDRYIRPETLGSDAYLCASCGTSSHGATKRLAFHSLHPILPFQLKRYEQVLSSKDLSATAQLSKVEQVIRLPLTMDMTPYTAAHVAAASVEEGESFDPVLDANPLYHYALYAVVNHEGKMDTGHYTSYIRHEERWYLCDDASVSLVPEAVVVSGRKAYMAFYRRSVSTRPG